MKNAFRDGVHFAVDDERIAKYGFLPYMSEGQRKIEWTSCHADKTSRELAGHED